MRTAIDDDCLARDERCISIDEKTDSSLQILWQLVAFQSPAVLAQIAKLFDVLLVLKNALAQSEPRCSLKVTTPPSLEGG